MQIASFVIGCLVLTIAAEGNSCPCAATSSILPPGHVRPFFRIPTAVVPYVCRQVHVIPNEYIIVLKPGIDGTCTYANYVNSAQSLPHAF